MLVNVKVGVDFTTDLREKKKLWTTIENPEPTNRSPLSNQTLQVAFYLSSYRSI